MNLTKNYFRNLDFSGYVYSQLPQVSGVLRSPISTSIKAVTFDVNTPFVEAWQIVVATDCHVT